MSKPRLTREAKAFIKHGEVTYKNGPWDNEALHVMDLHGFIAGDLVKGELKHPPVCKDCGKVIVPAGVGAHGFTYTHMGKPVTQVQTEDPKNPMAKVTAGTTLADTVDNENHEARPAEIGTPPVRNRNLGPMFK